MNPNTDQLRYLPAVDDLLHRDWAIDAIDTSSRSQVVQWIREAVSQCRDRILAGHDVQVEHVIASIAEFVRQRLDAEHGQSIRRVINATGVLLHTNLGRAPMAASVVDRLHESSGYANVELDLDSGRRCQRGERGCRLLSQLTGAEDAVVVNNCAAATMLVLQTIAFGKEVIVSRGQLVEIGGGFRLPDVFRAAGVLLREVGTTNRTYVQDYERAMNEQTGALIRVHRSNFSLSGFVTEPSIHDLVGLDRTAHVPVIDDVGSGCMVDLREYGLQEPNVIESVTAGADLTLFSGDKLFGGPQCGIIVGRREWIDRLRRCPLMRAIRCDKLTLSAVEATAEIYLRGEGWEQIPVLRMLRQPADQIRQRCEQIQRQVDPDGHVLETVPCQSPIGGGSVPGATLPSWAIRVAVEGVDALATRLRTGRPAIQGRIVDDALWLDLRTVSDGELPAITQRLQDELV